MLAIPFRHHPALGPTTVSVVSTRRSSELPAVHEAWLPRDHPLHRPRHGGKQLTALVCAALFFAAPTVSWMLGARAEPVENRPLASFPSPSDGWGFFTGLHPWASDNLPFRGDAVRSVDAVSRGVFGEAPSGGGSHAPPVAGGDDSGEDTEKPRLDESVFPSVIEGKNGWMYLGHDVSYKCVPRMKLDRVVAGLQRWREVVEASGREFHLIVAPDKSTVHPEHLPESFAGKQCATEAVEEFWRTVPRETGAIDMRSDLRSIAERNGRAAYHAIDTHWTHEAGVAMTYALAERVAPGSTSTWKVEPSRFYPHTADIPELRGQNRKVDIQAYSLAPDGRQDNTRFVPSDFQDPLHVESTPTPGMVSRPTRMIADSFTQFASPYLAAAFADLTIAHPDALARDPAAMAQTLAEGEVVMLELSERFVAGGRYPMLDPAVAEQVGDVLARHPVR